MNLDVAFLPGLAPTAHINDATCIILDIFRATSTIVTAMANGCHQIIPVSSAVRAHELAAMRPELILAGERQSIKIAGFTLGNSPLEFTVDRVAGKTIVMTTTNGTAAIVSAATARSTLIGSWLNAAAVCRLAQQLGNDIIIICAGTDQRYSLEDSLCAGYMVQLLATAATLSDAAHAALLMYQAAHTNLELIAGSSTNGRRLQELERQADISHCLTIDSLQCVPLYRDEAIYLPTMAL